MKNSSYFHNFVSERNQILFCVYEFVFSAIMFILHPIKYEFYFLQKKIQNKKKFLQKSGKNVQDIVMLQKKYRNSYNNFVNNKKPRPLIEIRNEITNELMNIH